MGVWGKRCKVGGVRWGGRANVGAAQLGDAFWAGNCDAGGAQGQGTDCGGVCMCDACAGTLHVMHPHLHTEFGGQIPCCNSQKGIFVSYACRTIFVAIFV